MMSQHPPRVAVYPGSFDPFTRAHLDIAQRASRMWDELIVAVAQDAEKSHVFSLEDRVRMAAEACCSLPNVRVEAFAGLVVNFAKLRGACWIVKGLRTVADFEREMQMGEMNHALAPQLETCYLMAAREWAFLSSSLVRHVHALGGDVSRFVTPGVLRMLDTLRAGEAGDT